MSLLSANWPSTKLGRIARDMFGGGTPSTKNPSFWQGNIPWITSKSLGDSTYLTAGEKTISEEAVCKSATHIVPAGNLIFATRVGVGKVVVTKIDVAISQDCTGILVDPTQVDPTFLAYQLRTDSVQKFVDQNKRGATIQGITRTSLQQVNVVVPPLSEQRRIAIVLNTVKTAIEQQARLIALTQELKRALMGKLFTEGLHGEKQKMTEIGPVPKGWEVLKLQEAVEYIDYGYSAPIPKMEPEGGVKIVSTADINRKGQMLYWKIRRTTAPEKTVRRLTLVDGDVLFNWRNSAELIGKTGIFEQQPEPHIFASFILRIRCDEKKMHNYFLKHLLNHYREQGVFVKLSRRAVNQANYNKNEISELKIPFPEYEEQYKIAKTIGAVESKIIIHESKKNLLEELFRSLLHQLMTGQMRVNGEEFAYLEELTA